MEQKFDNFKMCLLYADFPGRALWLEFFKSVFGIPSPLLFLGDFSENSGISKWMVTVTKRKTLLQMGWFRKHIQFALET